MILTCPFFRSVHLEHDWIDESAIRGYRITAGVRAVLNRILEGLGIGHELAFTITGPYGSGKSAFALFLIQLLSRGTQSLSYALLKATDPVLAERVLPLLKVPFFPIPLTLRRAPLSQMVLEGLQRGLARLGGSDLGKPHSTADGRMVLEGFETLQTRAAEAGYGGVILVLDELGKALEYAARHPGEDIYLLQELAEFAVRAEHPLLIVGILHQAFEQYGEHLELFARREWAKVQGRFSDIAFLEPPEEQVRLVASAVASLGLEMKTEQARVACLLVGGGFTLPGLGEEDLADLAARAYPLHTTVLLALPYLFRRLAQNERSIFAYLFSGEPFGLQDLLRRGERVVRLSHLFDYFMTNLTGALSQNTFARRLLEVADALERSPDLSPLEAEILKTVGLINLLGEVSPLQSKGSLISLAVSDTPADPEIEAALVRLRERSLLVFRRFDGTYRVWEGSDIDLEARLEVARPRVRDYPLSKVLSRYLSYRPLVARRHSYENGALRFFEVRYLDAPVSAKAMKPQGGADGVVACCLPASPLHAERFLEWARSQEIAGQKHLMLVLPQEIRRLREVAHELAAVHWVWENTPELRDDRVARRELAERTAALERVVAETVGYLMDPNPEPKGAGALWIYGGEVREVRSPREVSSLLSEVMDRLYPLTPRLHNELINRRILSSAAAAARRTLIERMFTQGEKPFLGMEGYPPERSIYESVLMATRLHREEDGVWTFAPPSGDDPRGLRPVWEQMECMIFGALNEPYPVDRLFKQLSLPPYGVMSGVLPVLLAAFLQAYSDETSLYREGTFLPEPGVADFELLMRRPELFAVAGHRLQGERAAVVARLSKSLEVKSATVPVVRALIRMVRSLPDAAWRTRQLPAEALKLREAFEQARSPERLLFVDLPLALGEAPFNEEPPNEEWRIARFFDKLNQAIQAWAAFQPNRIQMARDILLTACGLPKGEAGWRELRRQAKELEGKAVHARLVPLINRLNSLGEESNVLESVLALVAGKPPKSWSDADFERFPVQAEALGTFFREATHLLGVLTSEEEAQSIKMAELICHLLEKEKIPSHVVRATLVRLLREL